MNSDAKVSDAMTEETAKVSESSPREKGKPPGRHSIMWDTISDTAAAPLLFPIATMQSALPAVGTAVNKYGIYKSDPIGRGRRTNWSLMRFLWDGKGVAHQESVDLRKLHANIKGDLPDGQKYFALDPKTFRIVPDTFLEGVIRIRRQLGKPLSAEEEEQLYEEYIQLCLLFGIPRKYIEPTLEDFWVYYEDLIRNTMTYNETVDHLLNKGVILPPRVSKIAFIQNSVNRFHARYIYPLMSVCGRGGLNPLYRELHNIPWTEEDEQKYERIIQRMRTYARWVPRFMRYNPVAYLVMLGIHGPDLVSFDELTRIEKKKQQRKKCGRKRFPDLTFS